MTEKLIEGLVVSVLASFLGAWVLMLLIGNLHASLFITLPAIGYWDSLSIAVPMASVTAFLKIYISD